MDESLLDKFETAQYEDQIVMYLTALEKGQLDEDTAFEMLNTLFEQTAVLRQRARFDELANTLRSHAPDLYKAEAGYVLEWQITHALVDGRFAHLPALTQELAQRAADFPSELIAAGEKLAYYGQLEPLAAMQQTAWPHIQAAEFDEWAVEEFAVQAMNYNILQHLMSHPTPNPNNPELLAQLDAFAEVEPEELAEFMSQLTGQAARTWQPDDFKMPLQSGKSIDIPEEIESNLMQLLREFMYDAHNNEGIPISRAALAYWPLNEYLLSRLEESARSYQPRRKKDSRFSRKTYGLSPLCPTTISLAQFLSNMLELLLPQHYPAAAMMAVLPTWLRFLHQRGLITAEQQAQAASGLQELLPELREFWSDMPTDPGLVSSLGVWE